MNPRQRRCLEQALADGHRLLSSGMPALDVVESAIRLMEASGLFNAGLGSKRQLDGVQRMDASIMEGTKLRGGAVASLEQVLHPISAARHVMERTPHVLLVGPPATRFARYGRIEPLPAPAKTRTRPGHPRSRRTESLIALYESMTKGPSRRSSLGRETVGAVALDVTGTVAAGASTGGVEFMLPGRVGDTPLLGCGVYADNQGGAVSMTGIGESMIRLAAAKEIALLVEQGRSPSQAATRVLRKLVSRTGGSAGTLVLAPSGAFAIRHVTPRMAAGHWNGRGKPFIADRF